MADQQKQSKSSLSPADYERLGRSMETLVEGGYLTRRRIMKMNFARGLFFGLGSVVGGTIVLAVLLWTLSLFEELPVIGDLAESVSNSISSAKTSN